MLKSNKLKLSNNPVNGFYGHFGGKYVPEVLMPALSELETAFASIKKDKSFIKKLNLLNLEFSGRPTPLFHAHRLSSEINGAQIYLKREDLLHGGAHKINNVIGQGLLAQHLGKKRLIAETGAGQHGVATAIIGASLGLETVIYMGKKDIERQKPNVDKMKLLGAEVISVSTGSMSLKDSVNAALRDWITSVESTHYLVGSVVGPHPFPEMVRYFQSVIGQEIKEQSLSKFGSFPDTVYACVGGGSNAAGTFYPLIDEDVKLIGIEAGGRGDRVGDNSASISKGSPGLLHGSFSHLIQDPNGQVIETHSISAGLDYPGVGPEHSFWKETKRVDYKSVRDQDAVNALIRLSRREGIIPALESSHALAAAIDDAKLMNTDEIIVVTLSGRGDKDLPQLIQKGLL